MTETYTYRGHKVRIVPGLLHVSAVVDLGDRDTLVIPATDAPAARRAAQYAIRSRERAETPPPPRCPVCQEPLRQIRRGATLVKRGPCYVCPVAESEIYQDGAGRLHRFGWAKHTSTRTYEEHELEAAHV